MNDPGNLRTLVSDFNERLSAEAAALMTFVFLVHELQRIIAEGSRCTPEQLEALGGRLLEMSVRVAAANPAETLRVLGAETAELAREAARRAS